MYIMNLNGAEQSTARVSSHHNHTTVLYCTVLYLLTKSREERMFLVLFCAREATI